MIPQFRLFPEAASTFAGRVDQLYFFLLAVAAFFTALICILILTFSIRYRRRSGANSPLKNDDRQGDDREGDNREGEAPAEPHETRGVPPLHDSAGASPSLVPHPANYWLEAGWGTGALLLTMVMFVWGADLFFEMRTPPAGAIEIEVIGKQWMWKVQHPEGRAEINELHIPVGRPVKLNMISQDVIHSFYVPAFRVKQDVLPARYSTLWFEATQTGRFHLLCAEYCGTSHSQMRGTVIVMEPEQFSAWLSGETGEPPAVAGRRLFERFRCGSCHKSDIAGPGPNLAGLFGTTVPLQGGAAVVADEQYLRDSILNSSKQIVAGYQPLMPSYQGQLNESEVLQLIAYLRTLKAETPIRRDDDSDPKPD